MKPHAEDIWVSGGADVVSYGSAKTGIYFDASMGSNLYKNNWVIQPQSIRTLSIVRT